MTNPLPFLLFPVLLAAAGVDSQQEATQAVRAFHQTLAEGDRDAALALLSPDVVIFEAGGAELSREQYASQHLDADMKFSGTTTREIVDQRGGASGDIAWVLTRSTTQRKVRKQKVTVSGVETMVLERTAEGWRIIHVHWSSRKAGQ